MRGEKRVRGENERWTNWREGMREIKLAEKMGGEGK